MLFYLKIVPFLHCEAHNFCTNILIYDFHMHFIDISWYWTFVMKANLELVEYLKFIIFPNMSSLS